MINGLKKMKITHYLIVFDTDKELFDGLSLLGFTHTRKKEKDSARFAIPLDHPDYDKARILIQKYKGYGVIDTEFTQEDLLTAEWNRFWVLHEWGYPQPQDGFKYREITLKGICLKCGAGYTQLEPYRIKGKPKMGRNPFFSLYWKKTYFCVPEVVETLKQNDITGYEVWDAINHSTGESWSMFSQLVFPVITEPGLDESSKGGPETCQVCGRTKYEYHRRGMMKYRRDALKDVDIQETHEWFGSGGATAYREGLVSNRLTRLIIEQGWRGIALRPVELI
jgi:hypothetical protein